VVDRVDGYNGGRDGSRGMGNSVLWLLVWMLVWMAMTECAGASTLGCGGFSWY